MREEEGPEGPERRMMREESAGSGRVLISGDGVEASRFHERHGLRRLVSGLGAHGVTGERFWGGGGVEVARR